MMLQDFKVFCKKQNSFINIKQTGLIKQTLAPMVTKDNMKKRLKYTMGMIYLCCLEDRVMYEENLDQTTNKIKLTKHKRNILHNRGRI